MLRSSHHLDDESTDSMTSATNLDDILSLQVDFFTAGITIMTWPSAFSESLSSEGSGDEESLSCQTSLRNWRIGLLSGGRVSWWYSNFRNYAPPLHVKEGIITEKVFPVFSESFFWTCFGLVMYIWELMGVTEKFEFQM